MKTLNKILLVAMTLGLFVFTSCEKDDDNTMVETKSIAQTAASNADFSTLVAALSKADLVSTLDGEGSFTVFAPTNAAFEDLFADLGVSGLDDLSAEALKPILLYHVLGAKKTASMIETAYYSTLSPAQGNFASMLVQVNSGVKINNQANVTTPDLMASNGVIHVIDKVLLPPTVVDIALANSDFSTLVDALVKAELVETLSGTGPFTVFAPANSAFSSLFTDLEVSGIVDLSADALVPILTYHVVSGNVLSTALTNGNVETLNGNISIMLGTPPTINTDSQIVAVDVQGTNGVVHVINKVLLPPAK
ncbi:MAG: fasciclin domain-containing protein [Bacteroidales bacterium]